MPSRCLAIGFADTPLGEGRRRAMMPPLAADASCSIVVASYRCRGRREGKYFFWPGTPMRAVAAAIVMAG